MAKVKVKKELERVYDIISSILKNQPTGEIEIVFEKTENRRLLQIKGDKEYILLSYEDNPTKLFVNGDIISDNIKPIPKKGVISDIESFVYGSSKFEFVKHCKDDLGRTIIVLRKTG
ncbi:MAG: hypothetical protein JHC31_02105 [Sulfurihydrogenibium sp.]|jgi:hypothetical protein|nr:hypothetical protein [Sulfurihydrogenibium sp.]